MSGPSGVEEYVACEIGMNEAALQGKCGRYIYANVGRYLLVLYFQSPLMLQCPDWRRVMQYF